MQINTGKFHAICDALNSDHDPDAAVRAALEVKHKLGRWEQFKRHMKGAGKLAIEILKEIMTDDEFDELMASVIKRKV